MILLEKNSWEVKATNNRGQGLFATKDIAPGTVVGDYLGKVLRTAEIDIPEEKENFYLMYYHDKASIYPDLTKSGVHLFNHSCMPNCGLFTFQGHVLFFSLKYIFAEEELTVSYMLPPKDSFCNPCNHICNCGSKFCRKTMHQSQEEYDKWRIFQDDQSKKTKRKRVTYGKELAPLPTYPKSLPDNSIYSLFGTTNKSSKVLDVKKMPSVKQLRKLIRNSGRVLEFPTFNLKVYGIEDDQVVSEKG